LAAPEYPGSRRRCCSPWARRPDTTLRRRPCVEGRATTVTCSWNSRLASARRRAHNASAILATATVFADGKILRAAAADKGHEVSKADDHYSKNHGADGQRRPRECPHRLQYGVMIPNLLPKHCVELLDVHSRGLRRLITRIGFPENSLSPLEPASSPAGLTRPVPLHVGQETSSASSPSDIRALGLSLAL